MGMKKQRRRAGTVHARLKFDKLEGPQVLGCFWRAGPKGGANAKMKKWQAIVFTTTPISTSFTTPVPYEITPQTSEQQIPPALVQPKLASGPDYSMKYSVKYLVKHLVQQAMRQDIEIEPSSLANKLMKKGGDLFGNNPEFLERYSHKYFNKFKYLLAKANTNM